jgi:hypothetical protein
MTLQLEIDLTLVDLVVFVMEGPAIERCSGIRTVSEMRFLLFGADNSSIEVAVFVEACLMRTCATVNVWQRPLADGIRSYAD